MNANLRHDIGPGAAVAAPSSWLGLLPKPPVERTPKPQFCRGDIGEVKKAILKVLVATPAITVKQVRLALDGKYSISRINSGLSQLHAQGRATRSRKGGDGFYRYTARSGS